VGFAGRRFSWEEVGVGLAGTRSSCEELWVVFPSTDLPGRKFGSGPAGDRSSWEEVWVGLPGSDLPGRKFGSGCRAPILLPGRSVWAVTQPSRPTAPKTWTPMR